MQRVFEALQATTVGSFIEMSRRFLFRNCFKSLLIRDSEESVAEPWPVQAHPSFPGAAKRGRAHQGTAISSQPDAARRRQASPGAARRCQAHCRQASLGAARRCEAPPGATKRRQAQPSVARRSKAQSGALSPGVAGRSHAQPGAAGAAKRSQA